MINHNKMRTVVITAIAILFIISLVWTAAADDDNKGKHKKAKFYVDRSHYHKDKLVKFTLKNREKKRSIFIPCDSTILVKNKKNGHTVAEVPWELKGGGCDATYGVGRYELEPRHNIKLKWDQTDENGVRVDKGKYKAYTSYFDDDDRYVTVKTNSFKIKSK